MSLDLASSTMGTAVGLRLVQNQFDFSVKALSQAALQQDQAVAALFPAGEGAGSGGSVTETRGQNLNIVV